MEAQFSLPYSEYQTIATLSKVLPKREGYAFFVPVSRQQVSVDLMILHAGSGKTLRGQVKSSKHFDWSKSPTLRFWYPNFRRSYRQGAADVFFLFGTYPLLEEGKNVRHSHAHWQHLILALSDQEMRDILEQTGRDRFFQFGIDPQRSGRCSTVMGTRGGVKGRDLGCYLLERRSSWLRERLN